MHLLGKGLEIEAQLSVPARGRLERRRRCCAGGGEKREQDRDGAGPRWPSSLAPLPLAHSRRPHESGSPAGPWARPAQYVALPGSISVPSGERNSPNKKKLAVRSYRQPFFSSRMNRLFQHIFNKYHQSCTWHLLHRDLW